MNEFDAILIGAGIIGCSIARSLAGAGWKVAIVEKGEPGQEASWAAAGMLSPSAEAEEGSRLFPLCRASLKLYPALVEELREETGIDPQYRADGTLLVFSDAKERGEMARSVGWQRRQGIAIAELSSKELMELEPRLATCAGAFFLAEDHQVDNRQQTAALIESCRRRGVRFLLSREARQVCCEGGKVVGIATDSEHIRAKNVVNTAGAWAAKVDVPGLAQVNIRPVKGHMASVKTKLAPLRHVVRTQHLYLVPRRNGAVVIGSTMEEVGFDKTIDSHKVDALIHAARRLCPALVQSEVLDRWTGLRPASPDGMPILGPTRVAGYWTAVGHFRNGILLAPITAQIISSWMIGGAPDASPEILKLLSYLP